MTEEEEAAMKARVGVVERGETAGTVLPGEAWLTLDRIVQFVQDAFYRDDGVATGAATERGIRKLIMSGFLLVDGEAPLRRFRMAIPPGARPVSDISKQIGHPSRTG